MHRSGWLWNMPLREREFIDLLRNIPLHDGARGLDDDAAVIPFGDRQLIITKDMMVQGVHYFNDANPADIAWKLLAVNLSDLAAKGAYPIGVMLGFTLSDDAWDRKFAAGFQDALSHYNVTLLGGDTVSSEKRILSLTAIGQSQHSHIPSRSDAKAGDILYLSGPVGDAYAGYEMVSSGSYDDNNPLVMVYNRPIPHLSLGQRIASNVHAMMDVSDGLLIDTQRMADASQLRAVIELDNIPLSKDYIEHIGWDRDAILKASSWGDDYVLLFSADRDADIPSETIAIGEFTQGNGVQLTHHGDSIALPSSIGYQH